MNNFYYKIDNLKLKKISNVSNAYNTKDKVFFDSRALKSNINQSKDKIMKIHFEKNRKASYDNSNYKFV
jgi:hypothetical protein